MATAPFRWYGAAGVALLSGQVDVTTHDLRLTLHTSSYAPSDTHTHVDDLTDEVSAGGAYATGGAALAGVTATWTPADSWPAAHATTTAYAAGDIVRPADGGNGHLYLCVTSGTSGGTAPSWPTTAGVDVDDGTAVWSELGAGATVLDCDPVLWEDATITARYAVLSDRETAVDGTSPLLGWLDFGEDVASSGGDFTVEPSAAGLAVLPVG